MVNAWENSASGVSEMLDECHKQTDENQIEFSQFIEVLEGDVGTWLKCESLVQ